MVGNRDKQLATNNTTLAKGCLTYLIRTRRVHHETSLNICDNCKSIPVFCTEGFRTFVGAHLAALGAPGAAQRAAAAHGAQHLRVQRARAAPAVELRVAVRAARVHATVTC